MNGLTPDKVKAMLAAGELDTKTVNSLTLEYVVDLYVKVQKNERTLSGLPCVRDSKYYDHRENERTVGTLRYWADKLIVPVVVAIVTAIVLAILARGGI